ncbi:MAG: hypothetical protein KC587_15340, partial [Nitrospira sp.]|nr:hypothetical protein [Nitrospira sp.]
IVSFLKITKQMSFLFAKPPKCNGSVLEYLDTQTNWGRKELGITKTKGHTPRRKAWTGKLISNAE